MFLCYSKPAHMSYLGWENEALPLGNGKIGAKVFGGINCELIHFNEKTLWSGGKDVPGFNLGIKNEDKGHAFRELQQLLSEGKNKKAAESMKNLEGDMTGFGAYQSFGNLYLQFPEHEIEPRNYIRDLDFDTASAMVTYQLNRTVFTRHYFISYPDNVFVARIECEQRKKAEEPEDKKTAAQKEKKEEKPILIDLDAYFISDQKGVCVAKDNMILLEGNVNANKGIDAPEGKDKNSMKYGCAIKIITDKEGSCTATQNGKLQIRNAKSLVIIMNLSTNYRNSFPDFFSGADPLEKARLTVEKAAEASFKTLYQKHLDDYRALYNRVSFTLGEEESNFSSDFMLKRFEKKGEFKRNIITHLFQYARYLLIASSREGSLPANLQGIWNGKNDPPWCCDYHFNVNVQMNYWGAYVANLCETALPYIDFVESLRKPGRIVANKTLGIGEDLPDGSPDYEKPTGWMIHTMVTPLGFTGPGDCWKWGWAPTNGAWAVQNMYDYYLYTLDLQLLHDKIYPTMEECALMWTQLLYEDKKSDRLTVSPGYSPEHGPVTAGNTYDQSIICNLYENLLDAAKTLKEKGMDDCVNDTLLQKVRMQLPRLKPFNIGKWGQIKEWYEEDSFPFRGFLTKEVQKKHRHISHLLSVYPFGQIDCDKKDYAKAALVSLEDRGKKSTGWALAMRLLCYARLGKGNDCDEIIENIMKTTILNNYFGTHPPFQIDGNFGLLAGICEMLLQSQGEYIRLLPALPDSWSQGEINGLRARGNFTLDLKWKDGKLKEGTVISHTGAPCSLSYDGKIILVYDEKGTEVETSFNNGITVFHAEKGKKYTFS